MEQEFDVILCAKYGESCVSCVGENCKYLHVCRRWLGGFCAKRDCSLSHSLLSAHNKSIIESADYGKIECDEELRRIIRRTLPMICYYHDRGRCDQGKYCVRLHVCKQYILEGYCASENCTRGHDLATSHNIFIFKNLGISESNIALFTNDIVAPDAPRLVSTCTCLRCGGPQQRVISDGAESHRDGSDVPTDLAGKASREPITVKKLLRCLMVDHDGSVPASVILQRFELPQRYSDIVTWARMQADFHEGAALRRFLPIRHLMTRNGRTEEYLTVNIAFRVCLLYNYDRCTDSNCPYLHICFMHVAGLCTSLDASSAAEEIEPERNGNGNGNGTSKKRNRKNKLQEDGKKLSACCKLRHGLEESIFNVLPFDKEEFSEARVLQLVRCAHPSVCQAYNLSSSEVDGKIGADSRSCPSGDRCNDLHICNDHVLFRCPRGSSCSRNHDFCKTQCRIVLQTFGLESAKATTVGKCIVPCSVFSRKSEAEGHQETQPNACIDALRMLQSTEAQQLSILRVIECLIEHGTVMRYSELLKALAMPSDFPLWLYLRELCCKSSNGAAEDDKEDSNRIGFPQLERLHLKPMLFNWCDDWLVTISKAFGICRAYNQFGTCRRVDCVFLHVCYGWVAGTCDGRGCYLAHSLHAHCFNALSFTSAWPESRKLHTVRLAQPRVCSAYAVGCVRGEACDDLHICNDLVLYGECSASAFQHRHAPPYGGFMQQPPGPICHSNHDVHAKQCIRALSRFLLDFENIPKAQILQRVLPAISSTSMPVPTAVPVVPQSMPSFAGASTARKSRVQQPTSLSVVQFLALRDGSARVGDVLDTFGFRDVAEFIAWAHAQRDYNDEHSELSRYRPILSRRSSVDALEQSGDPGYGLIRPDDVVTIHGAHRACLMYNYDACFDKKCPYVHICMLLVAGLCDTARKLEQPVRPACRLKHSFDDRTFAALRLPSEALSGSQKLALVRAAHPQVCETYNYPPEDSATTSTANSAGMIPTSGADCPCPRGARCEYLHVCNAFMLMRCNDTTRCKRNHDFRALQCSAVFSRFGLDTAKPTTLAKCVLPAPVPLAVRKRWAAACASQRSASNTISSLHLKRLVRYVADHGGMVRVDQLLTAFQLPADFFLSSWLQEVDSREPSLIREVEQHRLRPLTINWHAQWYLSICRAFTICQHYQSVAGCQYKSCRFLHVCRDFIAGRCGAGGSNGSVGCDFSHSLKHSVFKFLDIDSLPDSRKIELIQSANPTVCEQYAFNGRCSRGDLCDRAHVCNEFVLRRCRSTCRFELNHDLKHPSCVNAFLKYGIDSENVEIMKHVILPARRTTNTVSRLTGSQTQSSVVTSVPPISTVPKATPISLSGLMRAASISKEFSSNSGSNSTRSGSFNKGDEYCEVAVTNILASSRPAPVASWREGAARSAAGEGEQLVFHDDDDSHRSNCLSPDSNVVLPTYNQLSNSMNEASPQLRLSASDSSQRTRISDGDQRVRSSQAKSAASSQTQPRNESLRSSVLDVMANNSYTWFCNYQRDVAPATGSSLLSSRDGLPDIDYVPIDSSFDGQVDDVSSAGAKNGTKLATSNDENGSANGCVTRFLCEAYVRGDCPKGTNCELIHFPPSGVDLQQGISYWWFYQPIECDSATTRRYAHDRLQLDGKLWLPFEPAHNTAIERAFTDPNQRCISLWAESTERYPFASAFSVEFEGERPNERFSATVRRKLAPSNTQASAPTSSAANRQVKLPVMCLRTQSQALFGSMVSRGTRWNWYYRVQAENGASAWRSCIDLMGAERMREMETDFVNGAEPVWSMKICTSKCEKTYVFHLSSMTLCCAQDGLDTELISRPLADASDFRNQAKQSQFSS